MRKELITALTLSCALLVPASVHAVETVVQDSCVAFGGGLTRIYFTATSTTTDYGVLSFQFVPATLPAPPECVAVESGAEMPWVSSLGMGGYVWFGAPPYPPFFFLGSQGGFYITTESLTCCYDVTFYDETVAHVSQHEVCFTACDLVPNEEWTWGAVKELYGD